MDFFKTKKINNSTIMITDPTNVHAFLVQGENKAVLVDTCTGYGNILDCVKGLTSLPVEVILTHGHCDHAGGAAGFGRIYLAEEDFGLVQKHSTMEMKAAYIRYCIGYADEKEIAPERTEPYEPLKDGQIFDLGGIVLEMIRVQGHTKGMTCVLNRTERTILFGDACNPSVFLWAEEAQDLR